MAESEFTIIEAIEEIALTDPISTVLFLVGGLLVTVSMVIPGGLALGAAADLLTGE
jgi:uncharacterized sodium:solute symporter family permease YidK